MYGTEESCKEGLSWQHRETPANCFFVGATKYHIQILLIPGIIHTYLVPRITIAYYCCFPKPSTNKQCLWTLPLYLEPGRRDWQHTVREQTSLHRPAAAHALLKFYVCIVSLSSNDVRSALDISHMFPPKSFPAVSHSSCRLCSLTNPLYRINPMMLCLRGASFIEGESYTSSLLPIYISSIREFLLEFAGICFLLTITRYIFQQPPRLCCSPAAAEPCLRHGRWCSPTSVPE